MKTTHLLFAIAALFAVGTAFGAVRAITPTAWNGDPNCWQQKRHAEKMQAVKSGGAKVVFIGDSITHFWESNGKAQAKKYFSEGDMKMLNLGTSGDRTEHVLWRLDNGELDGYEAKCILLMIGTNNSGHFRNFSDEPPSDTILGISEILKRIRAKQPKAVVVLTAIFPRGANETDSFRLRNDAVNMQIRKFCDGKKVFWCDFSDRFLDKNGDIKWVMPDRLHPGAQGYEIWYEEVKPYIDYALSDGKLPCPKNRYSKVKTHFEKLKEKTPATVLPATRIAGANPGKRGDWWLKRLQQKRNQIVDSKGEIDLVFFGDSITHNWERSGKNWLERLSKTYSILDIGYGGDRTQHLVWRGENGELDGYKAKCIMLMIGTNNSRSDKPEDVAKGIRRILEVIAKKQPQAKTLLLPIFPRGEGPEHRLRKNNEQVNAIIKGYADGDKVIWCDFNAKYLDEKGDTKWIMPDRLHPGDAGYKIWTEAVLPHFKTICGK